MLLNCTVFCCTFRWCIRCWITETDREDTAKPEHDATIAGCHCKYRVNDADEAVATPTPQLRRNETTIYHHHNHRRHAGSQ